MKVWKISFKILLILLIPIFLSGAGYVGTLPDLGINDVPLPEKTDNAYNDLLPLNKLTIPVKYKKSVIDETPYAIQQKDIVEITRLMQKLSNIINGDNSIKKFVANANILNLYVKNYNSKYQGDIYNNQKELLNTINEDTIKMKNYWLYCEKNKNYLLNYDTAGEFSQTHLENVKNEYRQYLDKAILDLKMMD